MLQKWFLLFTQKWKNTRAYKKTKSRKRRLPLWEGIPTKQNHAYRIITKNLWDRSLKGHMKTNKGQKLPKIPLHSPKNLAIAPPTKLIKSHKQQHTKKPTFLPKRRIEEELLNYAPTSLWRTLDKPIIWRKECVTKYGLGLPPPFNKK